MKLSSLIEDEIGSWPTTSSLNRVLRMSLELAKRSEEAPVAYVLEAEGETFIPMAHSWVGQRVRIVLDKEG